MSYLNICVVTFRLGKKMSFIIALSEDLFESTFCLAYATCAENGSAKCMPCVKSFITSFFSASSKWNSFDGLGKFGMTSRRVGSLSDAGRDD
jgi:hypothetical protein